MMFGMLIGVWANANFAEDIQFNRVQGYEAGGHIGLLIGIFGWLLLGAYYWVKGNNNNRKKG